MNDQKHTPGPWNFESYPYGHKPRVFSAEKLIGEIGNSEDETRHHDEWVANARLIAAAPELKAFAESILIYTINGDGRIWLRFGQNPACPFDADSPEAMTLLHIEAQRTAIIAKAEGPMHPTSECV